MSSATAFRGAFLDVVRDPWESRSDEECARFLEDGMLVVEEGTIADFGPYADVSQRHPELRPERLAGRLLVPGFVDCHVHYPQTRIIGSYGKQLLDWLSTYVFPEERKLTSRSYAEEVADEFFELSLRQGTTTVQSFATTSPVSVEAFFAEAGRRGVRALCGLTGIDREGTAPPDYLDTADSFYEQSARLIESYHRRGRLLYSISPRFALGSTAEQLARAGQLRREYPDCWANTHLSENPAEIKTVLDFFPEARDYLEVYERFGLVGPRLSVGHAIYLSADEFSRLSRSGASITFCPSSNLFLGSGLFRLDQCKEPSGPVLLGLGCDSGGGNSLSILRTLENAYKIGMLQFVGCSNESQADRFKISGLRGLYLATLGSAASLGLEGMLGTFDPGKEADFLVLDPAGTRTLEARNGRGAPTDTARAASLFFSMMMLGDDRCVQTTYVAGKPASRR